MDSNAHNLLNSFCMGNNAILHPIKINIIRSCIQLIKLNCIITETAQVDALLFIKGLIHLLSCVW